MGNVIFFTGSIFGMGLMLLIFQVWPPDEEADIAHYREVRDLALESFVGEVDEQELLVNALRGMMVGLDGHSRYYVEEETDRVDRDTSGHMVGIGVVTRFDKSMRILFPVEGSPAQEAGLRVGDEVLAVDGLSTEGLAAATVGALIKKPVGSVLTIEVRGLDGRHRTHEVVCRDMIQPSVRRVSLVDSDRRIGYVAVTAFSNETASEFDLALRELQALDMSGLIIDLRGNQGGVLSGAVKIARRFIRTGPITSTEGRGLTRLEKAESKQAWFEALPLVVLVDQSSASASEILAGALQDHRSAVLVGVPTYGKGLVQTINRFPERHSIAKITTSYYYTPAHRNVQREPEAEDAHGLEPDIWIPLPKEEADAIRRYVHDTFSPPKAALQALRAWEQAEGLTLVVEPPVDRHIEAALALFSGQLPESGQVGRGN